MSPTPVAYLDYAATAPVDPAVAALMSERLTLDGDFRKPRLGSCPGAAAGAQVARARAQVAALIGAAEDEIVFTSGATESDNLAILGGAGAAAHRGRHLVTARTEHKAVLDPCRHLEKSGFRLSYLTPAHDGVIGPDALAAALQSDTVLVSLMHANNETGVLQDLGALGALCRAGGMAFHTDCAQSAGKIPLDVHSLPVDFLSFTAHKLGGPKGIGALYVRRGARPLLHPVMFGGGQEQGLRPGTLATHQIAGFGLACELAGRRMSEEAGRLKLLRERLWEGLAPLGGVHLNGAGACRVPGILNVSFEGVEGESLVRGLDGIAVSTGAACNSETREPSYVLRALGRDSRLAESSLRFSLGRFTTDADIDTALCVVGERVRTLRGMSPAAAWPLAATGPAGERTVSGEAGSPEEGAWVRFHLQVAGAVVKNAHFQVLGCPHTMDTVQWLGAQLPGRSRPDLVPGTPAGWAESRQVPVEKLGRLLIVEDALLACLTHWA